MADLTSVDSTKLDESGLTQPAKTHFETAASDYASELLRRTVLQADADKASDGDSTEAIAKHVRDAAYDLASNPPDRPVSPWGIAGQVGEYLFTAAAGVGAGHLDKQPGQIAFGVCLALATILLVTRLARTARQS